MNLIGVHGIGFRNPDLSGVSGDLISRVSGSSRLRAAIGFWTLPPAALGKMLATRLSNDGFLCVDVHQPTQIDHLHGLVSQGANVFLHLEEASLPSEPRMPNGLMHAKALLFDMNQTMAELWVGSHNATARAYGGLNIEASIVIQLEQGCPLYREAEFFLNKVCQGSHQFDPGLIDWYKWIQKNRNERTEAVLHLIASNHYDFLGQKVTYFGNDENVVRSFPPPGGRLWVSMMDPLTFSETLYLSNVIDEGILRAANPKGGGLEFDARLHTFHSVGTKPETLGYSKPQQHKVDASAFFVTLELLRKEPPGTHTVNPVRSHRFVKPSVASRTATSRERIDPWFFETEGIPRSTSPILVANPRVALESLQPLNERIFEANRRSPIRRVVIRRPNDE